MITKKDFAEYLIEAHAESENLSIDEVKNNPGLHTLKSTSCGLALDYLGLLDNYKVEKEYLESRGGSFITIFNKDKEPHLKCLSTREMFELLPETI
jgi:hypothetical protein